MSVSDSAADVSAAGAFATGSFADGGDALSGVVGEAASGDLETSEELEVLAAGGEVAGGALGAAPLAAGGGAEVVLAGFALGAGESAVGWLPFGLLTGGGESGALVGEVGEFEGVALESFAADGLLDEVIQPNP